MTRRAKTVDQPNPTRTTPASASPSKPASPMPAASSMSAARNPAVSEEEIRVRAYQKWEAAGKPPGDGQRFWLEAERELRKGR